MIHYKYLVITGSGLTGVSKFKKPNTVRNYPITGIRFGENMRNPIGLNHTLSIHTPHLGALSMHKGEIQDELIISYDRMRPVYAIKTKSNRQCTFKRLTASDIGRRVVVLGEKLPVTYLGTYREITNNKIFAGYRRNDGTVLMLAHGTVTRKTKAFDKWKAKHLYGKGEVLVSKKFNIPDSAVFTRGEKVKIQYVESTDTDGNFTSKFYQKSTGKPISSIVYTNSISSSTPVTYVLNYGEPKAEYCFALYSNLRGWKDIGEYENERYFKIQRIVTLPNGRVLTL